MRHKIRNPKGVALLAVLIIVMIITIIAFGYLSKSDVELACGQNMLIRTQVDYLAESGLEHAKGMILNPQELSSEYWTGDTGQQITAGDNYYDVGVARDDSEPCDYCNYDITCTAYRIKNGQESSRSTLSATLRLDPAIALWTGGSTAISNVITVNGDVYCNGTLTNYGNNNINGDVFAYNNPSGITGHVQSAGSLSLSWPRPALVSTAGFINDFTANYAAQPLSDTLNNTTLGGPAQVFHRNGNLTIASNVRIEGMLIVNGDLIITGNTNYIIAPKNLPALFVTGNLILQYGSSLDIEGLAIIEQRLQRRADSARLNVLGGLFVKSNIVGAGLLYNNPTLRPSSGKIGGAFEFDGVNDTIEDYSAGSYLNGLSACTVALWVKSDVNNADRGIFFTQNPTTHDEELGMRYDRDGAARGGVSGIKASIRTTSGYKQIESSSYAQKTTWQHLALVWYSGSSLKLYINGKPDTLRYDEGPISGTVSSVQKFMLGQGTKSGYWDGMIDDVRIYNCALGVNDVNDLSNCIDVPAGLLMHWKLNEDGSGDITVTAAPTKTAVIIWDESDNQKRWQQAPSAFFKSIRRE